MKKSIIATGAASLALAAMPIAGVFAAATPAGDITDTLNVNIPAGCTIVNSNSTTGGDGSAPHLTNAYSVSMHNGELKTNIGGSANDDANVAGTSDNVISVSCNSSSNTNGETGWKLTAVGAGTADHETELYQAGATDQIVTGEATSGATSNWAFKVSKSAGAYATGYSDAYKAVPATEADIVTGSGSMENAFTMTYRVYVDQTQDTGTYTGAVLYTLYNPAA